MLSHCASHLRLRFGQTLTGEGPDRCISARSKDLSPARANALYRLLRFAQTIAALSRCWCSRRPPPGHTPVFAHCQGPESVAQQSTADILPISIAIYRAPPLCKEKPESLWSSPSTNRRPTKHYVCSAVPLVDDTLQACPCCKLLHIKYFLQASPSLSDSSRATAPQTCVSSVFMA